MQNAKLKISKLKEKYSKTIVFNNNGLTEPFNDTIRDHSEAVGKIVKQEKLTISDHVKETENQFKKTSEEFSELHTWPNCSLHNHDYVVNEIQNSNLSLSNSPPSSMNASTKVSCMTVEDLNISKPLENICFVSSSSDELNFKQVIPFKKAEKSMGIGSIQPYATQFSELDTGTGNKYRPKLIESYNSQPVRKTYGSNDNDSITSACYSEFNSKMSRPSIEEISSTSENEDNNSIDIVSDINGVISIKSIPGILQIHETEKTDPNLQQAELQNLSITEPSEGLKSINTKQKTRNSSPKSCSREISVASNIDSNSRPNNSDTQSEVIFTNANLTNNNKVVDTENIKLSQHVKRNSSMYKKRQNRLQIEKLNDTNPKTFKDIYQYNISFNHSPKKTLLKSCKLIRQIETNRDEFEELVQKALISSRLNVQHNLFYCENGTDQNCDQLMQQLLRNQIQMTRHFIESHHQMYLHCCQAVKMLSEKYVSNNEQAFQ